MTIPFDELLDETKEYDSPLSRADALAFVAEVDRLRAELAAAQAALANSKERHRITEIDAGRWARRCEEAETALDAEREAHAELRRRVVEAGAYPMRASQLEALAALAAECEVDHA